MTNPMPDFPEFQPIRIGAAPVIRKLIDEMGLIERIDAISPIKKEVCNVSVGTRIAALIVNQLTERKALYKVEDFYANQDMELLFGSNIQARDFNDDALARALDALYKADLEKVYMQAVKGVQQVVADLRMDRLHFDTTSLVYTGKPKEEEEFLKVVRGYSKDHRPDLPQIKFGMGTNAQGIPIYGDVLDGNQDDKTWNSHFMKAIKNWFSPEQLEKAIFVADSAFVTCDNLKELKRKDQPDFHFLSRLPENYKLSKTLKEEAWKKDKWEHIGSLVDGKDAAIYQVSSAKGVLHGETYRFLIVHSSKLDGRKQKSLQSQLEKERKGLEKVKEKVVKREFACETDAKAFLSEFLKINHGSHEVNGHIITENRSGKRKKRGRPKKGEAPPPPLTVYRIQLDIHPPSEEEWERLRQQASTFILITNMMEEQELSNIEMLKGYKEQQTVENRFRFLKNPYFVGRVFLEKPQRVEAFAYVMMLSVMVYSLFEYLIRNQMAKESEPLNLYGNRKSYRPTGEAVLEILDTVTIVHVEQNGQTIRYLPRKGNQEIDRILGLLGFDWSIYTVPHDKKLVENFSK